MFNALHYRFVSFTMLNMISPSNQSLLHLSAIGHCYGQCNAHFVSCQGMLSGTILLRLITFCVENFTALLMVSYLATMFYRSGYESDGEAEAVEHAEKLRQVKAVLEEVVLSSFIDVFFCMHFVCLQT